MGGSNESDTLMDNLPLIIFILIVIIFPKLTLGILAVMAAFFLGINIG